MVEIRVTRLSLKEDIGRKEKMRFAITTGASYKGLPLVELRVTRLSLKEDIGRKEKLRFVITTEASYKGLKLFKTHYLSIQYK